MNVSNCSLRLRYGTIIADLYNERHFVGENSPPEQKNKIN